MTKRYIQAKVAIEKANNKIIVIASDETLDRHGEVLPIDQWDLSRFKQAPRMMVDHDHRVEKIVGKWSNPRIQDKQLLLDADFHEFTPLAKAVKQMVEEGYLNTVSVGFIPHPSPEPEKSDKEMFELIETSWVTVPANPNAQVVSRMKALAEKELTPEEANKVMEYVKRDFEDLESSDEVLPDDEDEEDAGNDETPATQEEEKIITSIAEFKELPASTDKISVSYAFLSKLIDDSEQLAKLTADKKAKVEAAQREKLLRLSLRSAASNISHLLREMNKNSH